MSINSLIVNLVHAPLDELPHSEYSLAGLSESITRNEGTTYAPIPKAQEAGINQALKHVRDALALVQEFQESYIASNVG